MKYEAVIFDLFGTLIKNYPYTESNNVLRQMASILSVPADDFIEQWNDAFEERMTGALRNFQHCTSKICRQMGIQVSDEKIELAVDIRLRMNIHEVTTPRDEAIEVLSSLIANSCKTGLLSDCSTETAAVWKDSPLAPLIDVPVFSCIEGMKKPDHRFYNIALDRLAVTPENCIYVADGIGSELHSAEELGMYAVQIIVPGEDDYDQYREEWNGPKISSLTEVLEFVNQDEI
ncbi:HAD family hydrolase [Chloroflexota bacterium]